MTRSLISFTACLIFNLKVCKAAKAFLPHHAPWGGKVRCKRALYARMLPPCGALVCFCTSLCICPCTSLYTCVKAFIKVLHIGQGCVSDPLIKQPLIKQPLIKQPLIKQPLIKQPLIKQPLIKQPLIKWALRECLI
jgi:hypothetical protein